MNVQRSSSARYQTAATSDTASADVEEPEPNPKPTEASRPPKTIEEYLVGQLELDSGCTAEAVIPPPEACPGYVQTAGSLASMHFVTLVVIFGFMVILLEMSMFIFREKG